MHLTFEHLCIWALAHLAFEYLAFGCLTSVHLPSVICQATPFFEMCAHKRLAIYFQFLSYMLLVTYDLCSTNSLNPCIAFLCVQIANCACWFCFDLRLVTAVADAQRARTATGPLQSAMVRSRSIRSGICIWHLVLSPYHVTHVTL